METTVTMPWEILDRMERAVARVRARLLRATEALKLAGIPYAVAGGNAVASWVATVDEGAVRNTRDIDLLVYRNDFPAIAEALERSGFMSEVSADGAIFLDSPTASASASVKLLVAGEIVGNGGEFALPDVATIDAPAGFRVLLLEPIVQIELIRNRNKERMHLRDLVDVGLIDRSWLSKLPTVLAERLQAILDTPDGYAGCGSRFSP